jgi:superoxide dismutase, Cu-Zn family
MLKLLILCGAAAAMWSTSALADEITVTMHAVDAKGVGPEIGTIKAEDGPDGLLLTPMLSGLTPGPHGFHLHEHADCGPALKDGQMTAAGTAGGHFDPQKAGKHAGPMGAGHLGDLPLIEIGADGKVASKLPLAAPRLEVADLHGHAFVIHAKGDNYSDQPEPLGGGGGRVACGVVP